MAQNEYDAESSSQSSASPPYPSYERRFKNTGWSTAEAVALVEACVTYCRENDLHYFPMLFKFKDWSKLRISWPNEPKDEQSCRKKIRSMRQMWIYPTGTLAERIRVILRREGIFGPEFGGDNKFPKHKINRIDSDGFVDCDFVMETREPREVTLVQEENSENHVETMQPILPEIPYFPDEMETLQHQESFEPPMKRPKTVEVFETDDHSTSSNFEGILSTLSELLKETVEQFRIKNQGVINLRAQLDEANAELEQCRKLLKERTNRIQSLLNLDDLYR